MNMNSLRFVSFCVCAALYLFVCLIASILFYFTLLYFISFLYKFFWCRIIVTRVLFVLYLAALNTSNHLQPAKLRQWMLVLDNINQVIGRWLYCQLYLRAVHLSSIWLHQWPCNKKTFCKNWLNWTQVSIMR